MERQISPEEYFGIKQVPIGVGAILFGWDGGPSSVLDFRAMTGDCPHDCFHCFTDKRKKTLTLEEIKGVIDQAAEIASAGHPNLTDNSGFRGINYLGEGESTLDQDFFEIINYTVNHFMVPIIFTDAATKLRNKEFVKRIEDAEASVCPKCDSLFNADYQNWVVGDKTGRYFHERNETIEVLIEQEFNRRRDDSTRLGFDMVVTKRNVNEVEQTLRYCRDRNLWIVFSTYLPAGRSGKEDFDKSLVLSAEELAKMRQTVERVDKEYGFEHPIFNNFATSPCVEFMQIYGDGRVSPCPGNETIIGNIREDSLATLAERIKVRFPCHANPNGNCHYRLK